MQQATRENLIYLIFYKWYGDKFEDNNKSDRTIFRKSLKLDKQQSKLCQYSQYDKSKPAIVNYDDDDDDDDDDEDDSLNNPSES